MDWDLNDEADWDFNGWPMCYIAGNFVKSGIGLDLYKVKKRIGGVYDKKTGKNWLRNTKEAFCWVII